MVYSTEEHASWHNALPAKRVGASVYFRNSQNLVLIVKPNYKDVWHFPGGVVDENESPLHAAIREVKEEIGISISADSMQLLAVDYIPYNENDGRNDMLYFEFDGGILTDTQISQIKIQEEELDAYKFVPFSDLGNYTFAMKKRRLEKAFAANSTLYLEASEVVIPERHNDSRGV